MGGNAIDPPNTEAPIDYYSYYKGQRDLRAEQEKREQEKREQEKAHDASARVETITVEIGDNCVVFRDGLDGVIERYPTGSVDRPVAYASSWTVRLAQLMAYRNAKRYGVRLSEHCRITINAAIQGEEERIKEKGGFHTPLAGAASKQEFNR